MTPNTRAELELVWSALDLFAQELLPRPDVSQWALDRWADIVRDLEAIRSRGED